MYGPSLDHGELIGGGHFEPSGWEPQPRIPFSAGACAARIMLLVRTSSIPEQMLRILRLGFRRAMIVAKVALRLRSPFGIARTPLNLSRDTHAKANLSAVFVRQLNLLIGSDVRHRYKFDYFRNNQAPKPVHCLPGLRIYLWFRLSLRLPQHRPPQ